MADNHILFQDIFDVSKVNPEGRKFDRGAFPRRFSVGTLVWGANTCCPPGLQRSYNAPANGSCTCS